RRGHANDTKSDGGLASAMALDPRASPALTLDDDFVDRRGIEQQRQANEANEDADDEWKGFDAHASSNCRSCARGWYRDAVSAVPGRADEGYRRTTTFYRSGRMRTLAAATAMAALVTSGAWAQSPTGHRGRIVGVFEDQTGVPIEGAEVRNLFN